MKIWSNILVTAIVVFFFKVFEEFMCFHFRSLQFQISVTVRPVWSLHSVNFEGFTAFMFIFYWATVLSLVLLDVFPLPSSAGFSVQLVVIAGFQFSLLFCWVSYCCSVFFSLPVFIRYSFWGQRVLLCGCVHGRPSWATLKTLSWLLLYVTGVTRFIIFSV